MNSAYTKSYIYQLSVNKTNTMFYCIEARHGKATLRVYSVNQGICNHFKSFDSPRAPISTGWITEHKLFIQTEQSIQTIVPSTGVIRKLLSVRHKIVDILTEDDEGETFVYASIIDPDFIDFYKSDAIDKLASYSKIQGEFINECNDNSYGCMITSYFDHLKEMRSAAKRGNSISISNDDINSAIYLGTKKIVDIFGYIDRAIFIGEQVIYTHSSFISPQSMYILSLRDTNIKQEEISCDYEFYHGSCDINVPHYRLKFKGGQRGIVVLLHGGPCARYYNQYDPLINEFMTMGIDIYMINYAGSDGYDRAYREKLYGNGGVHDYADVERSIINISDKHQGIPLFVIGDSYGGYLAIRASLKLGKHIDKVYATNSFTDIRHQFIFSSARYVIEKYFPPINSPLIETINPINIAGSVSSLCGKLRIINGLNDFYCPHQQVEQFAKITNCEIDFLEDYPHFKVGYSGQWDVDKLILAEIEVMLNVNEKLDG